MNVIYKAGRIATGICAGLIAAEATAIAANAAIDDGEYLVKKISNIINPPKTGLFGRKK